MQRRSGDVLPPPADDYCNNSSAVTVKPIVKASSNVRLLVTWKTFFSFFYASSVKLWLISVTNMCHLRFIIQLCHT